MSNISLREATIHDEKLIYKWRNINELVYLSSNQKKVTLKEHKVWFRRKIEDLSCKILIIQFKNIDIGLIRLDLENKINCKISIYIIPGYEGKGFGYTALSRVIDSGKIECKYYLANVQNSNIASQRFFKKLGFIESPSDNSDILFKRKNKSR